MKQGNIENFKNLSKFKDITDFNNNIEQWMVDLKSKFTKSELVALKRLVRYSAKVIGVCNAKIGTLVSETHENSVGISRSTFKRMLSKAKAFGLLVVSEMERKNGSQSSNLYVFNRYVSAPAVVDPVEMDAENTADISLNDAIEPPKQENLNHPKTSNLLETSKNKNINKRIENDNNNIINNIQLGKEYINRNIPEEFVKLVSCFYGEFEAVEEFWKMVKIAERKAGYEVMDFDLLDISLNAFRETVKALKINKVKKNVFAFFYGTMQKQLKGLYEEFYAPVPEVPAYSVIPKIPALTDVWASTEELDALGVY
ncbi:hypothetical protein [Neobacillus bataviensis]|uniref:hypothetical protein n=1 Tax=Neobacillus bataviensis TaxID=220685 RepID=UPI0012F77F0E|nr:hypothetical protein [Neobacillus bataviensis]